MADLTVSDTVLRQLLEVQGARGDKNINITLVAALDRLKSDTGEESFPWAAEPPLPPWGKIPPRTISSNG